MIQIKIYDKDFNPLTAFNEGEVNSLEYTKTLGEAGDCSFTLNLDSSKVSIANLQHYNRVQVLVDGVAEWTGYLIKKQITFTVVQVRCRGLIGILKKRLVGSAYHLSGNAGTAVGTLLSYINGIDPTGITMGVTDISTSIDLTFEKQDALTVLNSIADAVGGQFIVNDDRTLDFKSTLGTDLSASVEFRYKITQPALANLLNFKVDDDGDSIITKSYGRSDALNSSEDDVILQLKYGFVEAFTNFRVANDQTMLDNLTAMKNTESLFSPELDLAPTVPDNFDVADIVQITLKNKIVDIDDTFQILEKSVKIVNKQKTISVKINAIPQDIVNVIGDLKGKVDLLETNL